ncbi:MAG: head maturation protease, ClpP-related [Undibacterium umbellatum]|uniref:head maturation protease, ClpP-related n=1 Tax=Undibacterium umbellatum TaxID=2762300 RepID=UPI003BB750A2
MKNKFMQLLKNTAGAGKKPLNVVKNEAGTEATLYVYDIIDSYWGVAAKDVAEALSGLAGDTTLHVRINSPGGDVFEGRAISTLLKEFSGKTVAHVDALAASAATTVALGCDEIIMADGAYFMIHNAWCVAIGNKKDMQDMYALLDKMDGTIANDYAVKSAKSIDEIKVLMDAETWFTAQEAVDIGLVDSISKAAEAPENATTKNFNLSAYQRAPKALTEPPKQEDFNVLIANNHRRLRLLSVA